MFNWVELLSLTVCYPLCRCQDSRQLYHKQVRHLICAVQPSSFQVQRSRLKANGCYWLRVSIALSLHLNWRNQWAGTVVSITDNSRVIIPLNTFTAIVDLSRFNNSCLKSPASTLVDLIFQSRSFSFNQLRDLSLLVGNLYSIFSISSWRYPIHSLLCLHNEPMFILCSEGEWAVSGCSL